ncbi:MAG: Fe-S cluster assembly protein SufD [Ignavibacteria bacterium]|nr:Fe-S cluster assembly protein SufD [Ignavibacteria bacterium]
MSLINKIDELLHSEFNILSSSFSNKEIIEFRRNNLEKFLKLGIPTFKNEDWKYTNMTFLNDIPFSFSFERPQLTQIVADSVLSFLNGSPSTILPIFNGKFIEGSAVLASDNLLVTTINSAFENGLSKEAIDDYNKFYNNSNPFIYLNFAMFTEGLYITVPSNTNFVQPIIIILGYSSETPFISSSFNFIKLEENSSANITVIFVNESNSKVLGNETLNINVGKNSNLELNILQTDLKNLITVNNVNVQLSQNSSFDSNTITLHSEFVRNNLNIAFEGQYGSVKLNGIYFVDTGNFVDNHTLIMHDNPNCISDENFRGILEGRGKAVFTGKIYVERDAQKTNAYQSNKNILLSDEARIHTRPQLEIYADDVKCTHGATAGYLDQDMLFYLKSRGVSHIKAKSLLLNSFVSENIEKIKFNELRDFIKQKLAEKLNLQDIFFCDSILNVSKDS